MIKILKKIRYSFLKTTPYINEQNNQTYYFYELDLEQARRVLTRESKFVRRRVIKYIYINLKKKFINSEMLIIVKKILNGLKLEKMENL